MEHYSITHLGLIATAVIVVFAIIGIQVAGLWNDKDYFMEWSERLFK